MDVAQQDKILSLLGEKYADQILHAGTVFDFFTITLKKDKIIELFGNCTIILKRNFNISQHCAESIILSWNK